MNLFSWGMCLQDIFFLSNVLHEIFLCVDGLVGVHYKSNYKGSVTETMNEYINCIFFSKSF